MTVGDTINPSRVLLDSNRRLDLVDLDSLSKQDRLLLDAASRAFLFTPLATAAAPVGLILTGGGITPNPTGGSDGKIRIQTDLLVAVDSDGRFLVKPSGTTIDVSIPSGGVPHQIYAYFLETEASQAKRRYIPVSAPFTEFTRVPYTAAAGALSIYVQSGGIVASAVGGVTVPLVFIGLASNSGGVITLDVTTTNNRLSTVKQPTSTPSTSSSNGSMRTLNDMVQASMYFLARTKFTDTGGLSGSIASFSAGAPANNIRLTFLAGMTTLVVGQYLTITGAASAANNGTFLITAFTSSSSIDVYNPSGVTGDANNGSIAWSVYAHKIPGTSVTPQATTNFGVYGGPRRGLDAVDRALPGYVTIGNGTTTFGDFDLSDFSADHGKCIKAAALALDAVGGGTIYIKPGTRLSTFTADVDISSSWDITIEGSGKHIAVDSQFILGGYKLKDACERLTLRGLAFEGSGTVVEAGRFAFEAYDCYFDNTAGTAASIVTAGTSLAVFKVSNCNFTVSTASADDSITTGINVVASSLSNCDVYIDGCEFHTNHGRRAFTINLTTTSGGRVTNCTFRHTVDQGSDLSVNCAFIYLAGTSTRGFMVNGCRFRGSSTDGGRANFTGIRLLDAAHITIDNCNFNHTLVGIYASGSSTNLGPHFVVRACSFTALSASNVAAAVGLYMITPPDSLLVENCRFEAVGFRINSSGSGSIVHTVITGCNFENAEFLAAVLSSGAVAGEGLIVRGNTFFSSTSGLSCPRVTGHITAGVIRCVWQGNKHSGYKDSAAATSFLGVSFEGGILDVLVDGNSFHDIQADVTYAGSTNTSSAPNGLINFSALTHRWIVTNNIARRLGASSTGANLQQVTCIVATTNDYAVDDATAMDQCVISGNSFGDDVSRCTFLQIGSTTIVRARINSLLVNGNSHRSAPLVASTSIAAYGIYVSVVNVGGANNSIQIESNQFHIDSAAGTLAAEWFEFPGSGTIDSFVFRNNTIIVSGGAFASNRGLKFAFGVNNFFFFGNVALVPGTTTSPVMHTDVPDPSTFNERFPADPTPGQLWTENLRVQNKN